MPTAEEMATFPMLSALTAEQREIVAGLARHVSFPAGHHLFEEGAPADRCFLIRSGRVAIVTDFPGAGPTTVQTVGPGDVLGWSWLVPPYRWRFAAVAQDAVSAVEWDAAPMRALVQEDPALGYPLLLGLFEALLARLHGTRARMLDLYGSPRER